MKALACLWAQLIVEGESLAPFSSRDGRKLKPVREAARMHSALLSDTLASAMLGGVRAIANKLLIAVWLTGGNVVHI